MFENFVALELYAPLYELRFPKPKPNLGLRPLDPPWELQVTVLSNLGANSKVTAFSIFNAYSQLTEKLYHEPWIPEDFPSHKLPQL
jgi:hypothetical protein